MSDLISRQAAKWIDLGDGEYKCPVCNTEFIYRFSIEILIKYFPTCPKCGADMRGEKAKEEENGRKKNDSQDDNTL